MLDHNLKIDEKVRHHQHQHRGRFTLLPMKVSVLDKVDCNNPLSPSPENMSCQTLTTMPREQADLESSKLCAHS